MKVVINNKFGGFGLTKEQLDEFNRLSGLDIKYDFDIRDAMRAHPALVQVVESPKFHHTSFAGLVVVEVPDDVKWHIEEYDGLEHVAEDHRTWRG